MKFLTSIDLSQNEIQNAIMQPLAAPPANPKIGQIYFNSIDLTLYLWTGEKWIPVPTKTSQLENDSGFITSGDIPEGAAASTTTPKMNGTAAVGTEMAFARDVPLERDDLRRHRQRPRHRRDCEHRLPRRPRQDGIRPQPERPRSRRRREERPERLERDGRQ